MSESQPPLPRHALDRLLADAEPLRAKPALPSAIGKYRIVREAGRGGMGIVYEATDTELQRRVALKVIAPPPGGEDVLRARLRREALAVARLSHPNIAAVYDVIEGAIVMQYVDGVPLSRYPRGDRQALVRLLRDAALAVHFAHEHSIIHRDLKPHNLMVESDRVMVMDFGLAKATAVDTSLSLSGHLLGTPSYMAPEQAAGHGHDVDARSDVYGLGATLYELLCGQPPFVDQDLMPLLRRVLEDEPPPPRSLVRDLPRDLETIVLKCLAKEKERRYASAAELARDLDRWLDGQPVLARRPSLGYRASKLVLRHRALFAVGAAGLLVLVLWWNERTRQQAAQAALSLSEQVATTLADAQMHLRIGETELARERLDQGIVRCRAYLARHDSEYVHFLLGKLLRARNQQEEALRELDRALELEPALAEARVERGLLRAVEIAASAAQEPARDQRDMRALALADLEVVASEPDALRRIDVALGRGERARLQGDLAGARREFTEALRLDPLNLDATVALSQIALQQGEGDSAWNLAMSAMDLYRGFGPAYLARAAAARDAGDGLGRVASRHELSAAEQEIAAGDRSPSALLTRAHARAQLDDVEGALADLSAALAAAPGDALAYGNRALVHARKAARLSAEGHREEALTEWQAAIEDDTSALTLEPRLAGALNNRGVGRLERERLLVELGRGAEATAEREAAGRDFDLAIESSPRFALALQNRALQRRRVAEQCSRAGEIAQALAAVASARADLDRLLAFQPDDAMALLERALLGDLAAECHVIAEQFTAAQEDRAQAAVDYDAAVRLVPEDARARGWRGVHRVRAGDPKGGVADLTEALRLDPDARSRRIFEQELSRAGAQR